MIAALLLGSMFLIILFFAVIVAVIYVKKRAEELEKMNQSRYDDLRKRIDDTNDLVVNQTKALVDSVNKLLKL